jgi:hypothetical protein
MRVRALTLLSCWLLGCSDCNRSDGPSAAPIESAEQPAALAQDAPEPASPRPPEPDKPWPKPGWTAISVDNDVPICVFADFAERHRAQSLEQVEPQKLRAGASVVMGAFGPWCVNEACDLRPSLQCAVARGGNTLTLRSRYWGDRKDGATCEGVPCRPITAGCETPALESGVYTVVHGERSFDFRVPGVLSSPCFGTEPRTPPE